MLERFVLDTWSPLSHKRAIGSTTLPGNTLDLPSWIGDHARRLQAYKLLAAYCENVARFFLATDNENVRNERREYGDAALLVNVVMAAVLGEDIEFVVDGADADPDEIERPEESTNPETGETTTAVVTEIDPESEAEIERLVERQEWVRDWARTERFRLKMLETERKAVNLGDGVYVVSWSNRKKRARVKVYDPGFYFPVLDDDEEFPRKLHLAWELPTEEGTSKIKVRRITWELVDRTTTGPDGEPIGAPVRLPYQSAEEDPATETCLMTDAIWTLDSNNPKVTDLTMGTAAFMVNEEGQEINRLDLGIDFIPVIHLPNTVAEEEHFGRSVLLTIAQILDDLQAADTDLSKASATTGIPIVALSGGALKEGQQVKPGTVFNLPAGGRMDVLDTAQSLDALIKYVGHLWNRLATNARVPEEVLGKVEAGDIAAGIILALSFGPMRSLVSEMRLVRDDKYRLLLKFVQRYAIIGDQLKGPVADAAVAFGSYLPTDLAGVVTNVTGMVQAKLISRRTGMLMLIEAGIPIEDIEAELAAIDAEDVEAAAAFLDATGDERATRERLGLDPDDGPDPEPEVPELPIIGAPPAPTPPAPAP